MSLFTTKKLLVTHDATFHADDIFATAALSILLDGKVKVVRSRDPELFKKADYIYDVGGEYDPARNRFDHHQKGGAGARENGVPYAAFGLVWKTYGEKICGSKKIAERIDEELVQAIDAHDNGIDIYDLKSKFVAPFLIENVFSAFRPSWEEEEEYDKPFMKLTLFARELLLRKIKRTKGEINAEGFVDAAYQAAEDKRVIVLGGSYPWTDTLMKYPEPLFAVIPRSGKWRVGCVRKDKKSFENRKSLPIEWAGLRDQAMAQASGVPDAVFCHNGRFLAVALSKEGAIALAQKALLA